RPQPARAGRRADGRFADDDDGLRRDGRHHHVGGSGHLPRHARGRRLGSREARRPLPAARSRRRLDVHGRRRHSVGEHRGERRLALADVYRKRGAYTYAAGWNWRAVAATLAGCALAWVGLIWPALRPLYDYAWFVGFGAALAAYFALMKLSPPRVAGPELTP